jgi:hypothetical protein
VLITCSRDACVRFWEVAVADSNMRGRGAGGRVGRGAVGGRGGAGDEDELVSLMSQQEAEVGFVCAAEV